MTEEPPPWARPDPKAPVPIPAAEPPAAAPVPIPAAESPAAEPEDTPDPADRPLFADRALSGDPFLFPRSGSRARVPEALPDLPRTVRRVRTEVDGHAGATVTPQASPTAPPPGRRPPLPAQAASAGADGASAEAGADGASAQAGADGAAAAVPDPRVGVVAGDIAVTAARPSLPGFPVLVVAAVITVAAVAGRALVGGVGQAALAAGVLGPVLLAAFAWPAQRMTRRGGGLSVTVRRFRVQPASGNSMAYLLKGELPPDALRTGDLVRVDGRRVRDGHTVVRSVDILATLSGPVIRAVVGRPSASVVAARWLSGLCIAAATLMLLVAAFVVGGAPL